MDVKLPHAPQQGSRAEHVCDQTQVKEGLRQMHNKNDISDLHEI